ncbi:MAG TPA: hypothetical protein VFV62_11490 [Gaiellaceae bacterium]|nr:hypothetical protein [Gaiellaceae bacterium]
MAGIAHPYEDTTTAADAEVAPVLTKPRSTVSFSDLVEAWALRDTSADAERRYNEQRSGFESTHGEITDGYLCETGPMAIVLTAKPPTRLEKLLLFRKERFQIYTDTERLVRAHPEVAHLLHRAEVQYVSVRQALRGLSQRLLVNWLFVWTRDVMISAAPTEDAPPVPFDEKEIRQLDRELDLMAGSYEQAASREAQIVYLGGMLMGVLALCALAVPVGLLLNGTEVPVDLTIFFGCVIAGALGALISVVTRMSADKFHVRHEVGRGYVQRVAAFRPFIGSVFGLLVYFALAGDVISGINVPAGEEKRFAFFLVFAFAAGFSERMVKEVLRSTSGDDEKKAPAEAPGLMSPAPRSADATGVHRVPDA